MPVECRGRYVDKAGDEIDRGNRQMLVRRRFLHGAVLFGAQAVWPIGALANDRPAGSKSGNRPSASDPLGDLAYPDKGDRAPPPRNFSSNHNYFIYGGGVPIRSLRVTVEATEDMLAPTGLNMQLNCCSPAGARAVYQQYCMGIDPKHETRLGWSNENFPSTEYRWELHTKFATPCDVPDPTQQNCKGDIFNMHGVVGFFPAVTNRIPAGCKLIYELIDKPDGTIVGATYSFENAAGKRTSSGPQLIESFKLHRIDTPVAAGACTPIYALQMNIVGLNGGAHTTLGSGAGRITYESVTPLTPLGEHPATAAAPNVYTAESSNIVYAELSAQPKEKIVQKFRTKPE
jgi:hypothetical protein